MKKFHLSDILTITTGRLLSNRGMDGVSDILNFLTTDDIFTHQIPRAMKICHPFVLQQLPQLNRVGDGPTSNEELDVWLNEQYSTFGEELELEPIPPMAWLSRDPVQELEEIVGKDKVIVVKLPPKEES